MHFYDDNLRLLSYSVIFILNEQLHNLLNPIVYSCSSSVSIASVCSIHTHGSKRHSLFLCMRLILLLLPVIQCVWSGCLLSVWCWCLHRSGQVCCFLVLIVSVFVTNCVFVLLCVPHLDYSILTGVSFVDDNTGYMSGAEVCVDLLMDNTKHTQLRMVHRQQEARMCTSQQTLDEHGPASNTKASP